MRFHVSNSKILEAVVIVEVVGRPCFGLRYAKESLKQIQELQINVVLIFYRFWPNALKFLGVSFRDNPTRCERGVVWATTHSVSFN